MMHRVVQSTWTEREYTFLAKLYMTDYATRLGHPEAVAELDDCELPAGERVALLDKLLIGVAAIRDGRLADGITA